MRQKRMQGYPVRFCNGHNRNRLVVPIIEDAVPFKIKDIYCRLISLTKGMYVIVDAADYEWLMQWKWYAMRSKDSKTYYAARDERPRQGETTERKTTLMHRAIAERKGQGLVDHGDHDGLNCTRLNLRPCTVTQNLGNTRLRKDNKIGIKGVQKRGDKYYARIRHNGIKERFGPFDFPEEAGDAYKKAALRVFGEFAYF